jgi:CheY-like chemotaxis protein
MNVLTSVPRALPLTSWEHYILVVGDDPELLDSYRAALRKAGFAAVGVNHGVGALRLVETQVPSAIVLDLIPERLDGREVQRVLKSNPHTRDIPIVAVAGAEHEDIDLESVTCLLRKPLSLDALVVAVKHVVRQSSPPRAEAS